MKMNKKLIDSNICPSVYKDDDDKEIRVCNSNTHFVLKNGFCAHVLPTEKKGQYTWFYWGDE